MGGRVPQKHKGTLEDPSFHERPPRSRVTPLKSLGFSHPPSQLPEKTPALGRCPPENRILYDFRDVHTYGPSTSHDYVRVVRRRIHPEKATKNSPPPEPRNEVRSQRETIYPFHYLDVVPTNLPPSLNRHRLHISLIIVSVIPETHHHHQK